MLFLGAAWRGCLMASSATAAAAKFCANFAVEATSYSSSSASTTLSFVAALPHSLASDTRWFARLSKPASSRETDRRDVAIAIRLRCQENR